MAYSLYGLLHALFFNGLVLTATEEIYMYGMLNSSIWYASLPNWILDHVRIIAFISLINLDSMLVLKHVIFDQICGDLIIGLSKYICISSWRSLMWIGISLLNRLWLPWVWLVCKVTLMQITCPLAWLGQIPYPTSPKQLPTFGNKKWLFLMHGFHYVQCNHCPLDCHVQFLFFNSFLVALQCVAHSS